MTPQARGRCPRCDGVIVLDSARRVPVHQQKGGAKCGSVPVVPREIYETWTVTSPPRAARAALGTRQPHETGQWRRLIREARGGDDGATVGLFEAVVEMSGPAFERFVVELLLADGYPHVEWVGKRGDGGVDVTAGPGRGSGRVPRLVVQCKRQQSPVGPAVVRQLAGSLVRERRRWPSARSLLVSNAPLSKQAVEELTAYSPSMEAISGKRFRRWVRGSVSVADLVRMERQEG